MKKNITIPVVIVVLIILVVVALVVFHKGATTSSSGSSNPSATSLSAKVKPVNNSVLQTKTKDSIGQYLTDTKGMTLYTYSADSKGVSNCTSACLSNWPAYQDKGATTGLPANLSVLKRTDDGGTQYTYKGMPLYYFAGDSSAGQVTGNGVDGFQVAKP